MQVSLVDRQASHLSECRRHSRRRACTNPPDWVRRRLNLRHLHTDVLRLSMAGDFLWLSQKLLSHTDSLKDSRPQSAHPDEALWCFEKLWANRDWDRGFLQNEGRI